MSRRPLIALSVAYFMLLCAAYGTGGLWAVYVAQLGGSPSAVGLYNAAGDVAIIFATLLSGWLADRYGRRRELFAIGCVGFAASWLLMGRVATWQQLTLVNAFGGFAFGMAINLIIILTGLLAGEAERGRSFGLLTFMMGASLLVGGLICGPIADRWGFEALFLINAVVCLACLLPALLFIDPAKAPRTISSFPVREGGQGVRSAEKGVRSADTGIRYLGRDFYLVTAATLVLGIAAFGGGLGRSITMNQLGYTATAISLTTALSGAISLPVPLMMGWLSDRIGRKGLLLLCIVAGLAAMLALAFAGTLGGFLVASALLAMLMASQPLLQALATDLLPAESLGIGLSMLTGASSIGLTVSTLAIGVSIQQLGGRPSFLLAALSPVLALFLVLPIREARSRRPVGAGLPVADA